MPLLEKNTGLYTDHYELAMSQGYYLSERYKKLACFDYFFRKNPFGGGFVVFSGLSTLLDTLEHFRFAHEDCDYLESIGFNPRFVEYLKGFSFQASIYSVSEGEIIFPNEPVLRVEGNILETQLVETLLLNILNFESLIATKASRIRLAAGTKQLLEFGLRRAQGLGGIHASKAAISGGFDKTSNVYSAYIFDLASSGTMAHSWVQSFEDELTAFKIYATYYPDNCILLVDTYDTLQSGVPNAIIVAKELEQNGHRLIGIRLDSGDLAYLSQMARNLLDKAGLKDVKIVASNQLDETIIQSLLSQGAPIDIFGVGTCLATGKSDAALDGVYKLSYFDGKPSLKISENIAKMTLPGIKTIQRFVNQDNMFYADGISLTGENDYAFIYHPLESGKQKHVENFKKEELMHEVMKSGKTIHMTKHPKDVAAFTQSRLKQLAEEHKRFLNPHIYKVGISEQLLNDRNDLAKPYLK